MSHSSQSTPKVGVWVVDRQHLLRNQLNAGLPTTCNITAYEVRTRAEAMTLAQAIKPDVVLINLGVQGLAGVKLLHQPFTERMYRDLLVLPDAEESQPETAADRAHPSSVDPFTLALCYECSELMRSEPDMAHQLFRTWRHGCLNRQDTSIPRCRQLKILVLALPTSLSESESTWLDVVERRTRQVILSQRERLRLSGWKSPMRSLKAYLSHLLHCAKGWLSNSWRVTWQVNHPFKGSVQ
jgi:hypothetical protein